MKVQRYESELAFTTPRDPLHDLLAQVGFLRAHDYVVELLLSRHGATKADASKRAKQVAPYVTVATDYLNQSLSSSGEVGFLPGYYAILNLLKIYILFSHHHSELLSNRYHGATYDVIGKDSHGLPTETIKLRHKGTLPLVYTVLTGRAITDNTKVELGDIYGLIADVGMEWELASGTESHLAQVTLDLDTSKKRPRPTLHVDHPGGLAINNVRRLPLLKGYSRDSKSASRYLGPRLPRGVAPSLAAVRASILPWLLYHPNGDGACRTPVSAKRWVLPEELPIAIALFHLSSIVRYKPEFVAKLRDSRYWPVLAAARSHLLYKFLLLFWSYVQQRTVSIQVSA